MSNLTNGKWHTNSKGEQLAMCGMKTPANHYYFLYNDIESNAWINIGNGLGFDVNNENDLKASDQLILDFFNGTLGNNMDNFKKVDGENE